MKNKILTAVLAAALLGASPAFAHGGMLETSIHDNASFAQAPADFKVTFEHESAIGPHADDRGQEDDRGGLQAVEERFPARVHGSAAKLDKGSCTVVEVDGEGRSCDAGRSALHSDGLVVA